MGRCKRFLCRIAACTKVPQIEFTWLHNGQVRGARALKDAINVACGEPSPPAMVR
jgi:hypothetical protein